MKWFAVPLVLAATLVGPLPSALACTCSELMNKPLAKYLSSKAVFQARPISINETSTGDLLATLTVERVWKGLSKTETVQVRTRPSSAACGVNFAQPGGSYLIFAYDQGNGFEANACTSGAAVWSTETLAWLGEGTLVTEPLPEPAPAPNDGTEQPTPDDEAAEPIPNDGGGQPTPNDGAPDPDEDERDVPPPTDSEGDPDTTPSPTPSPGDPNGPGFFDPNGCSVAPGGAERSTGPGLMLLVLGLGFSLRRRRNHPLSAE